ncbi:MAG: hypothetical protein HY650_12120 [Acidobacteria bacterium]|nr:hypothetical protein [Acidobacteriota bacterium]
MAQAGVPLTTIKDKMGHSTIRMTERFCHASRQREAVDLLLKRNPRVSARECTTISKLRDQTTVAAAAGSR